MNVGDGLAILLFGKTKQQAIDEGRCLFCDKMASLTNMALCLPCTKAAERVLGSQKGKSA